jgi:ferric-dicitrate binding protein FerR (iron transport regulator)
LFSKEVILSPYQKSTLLRNSDTFQISKVDDISKYTSWIYGYLEFDRENLADVLKSISRYYNINIELKLGDKPKIISGKLDLKTEHERMLNGLARLSNTRYTKKEGKYLFFE